MGGVIRISGGQGTGTGWNGSVEFRGDLPVVLGNPAIGDIWLVEKKTTFLGFTTYQSGLYIRDFNTGSLSDWRRLNVKVNFTDSEFAVVSVGDESKKAKFDLSLITTATTRTLTIQDKDGEIAIKNDPTDEVYKLIIGAIIETQDVTVIESGGVVSLNLEKDGGGDLNLLFSTGIFTFDSTPIASVVLTLGTDVAPVQNFIYIPESTKVLTVSTVSFPATEYIPIAEVVVQSAAGVSSDGVYKLHGWTDHTSLLGNNGHLSHVNQWIRSQHATWIDGILLTENVTTNGGSLDNLDVATTPGNALQLHPHSFPAFDTGTGSDIFVVNDPTTAFVKYDDLNLIIQDSAGTTLRSNNDRYNLVIWGVISEDGVDSKLFINIPEGKYTGGGIVSDSQSIDDVNNTANYGIPSDYVGVGILIARLTVKYTTASSGTLEVLQTEDLRGQLPTIVAGGSVGQQNTFSDALFRIFDNADSTKEIAFELSGISTGVIRTLTPPNRDINLVGVKTGTYVGDGTTAQAIDIGFNPKYLEVWVRATGDGNQIAVFEVTAEIIDDHASGISVVHDGAGNEHTVQANTITSLDPLGFTVDDNGANQHPNKDGQIYNYYAIG